jgi:hypothetical protein
MCKAIAESYLMNNNRKPICRLRFNSTQKFLGFPGVQTDSKDGQVEEKILINSVDEIYKFADRLKSIVARYDTKTSK